MTGWKPLVLGQCLEHLFDHRGRTPKKLGADFVPSGVQVISAKLVSGGRLNLDRERRYVSPEIYDRWMPVKLAEGDVLLTSEAPLGEAALVPSDNNLCLGQRLFALRPDPNILDPRFLYCWLRSPAGRSALSERSSGTTVLGIRQAELVKVEVPAPPVQVQRVIGRLLGSIDDLIENNRRRVEVLEEMARAIYREWFVHFRYPGYEHVRLVDSPLGPIPNGWKPSTLGEAGRWVSGGTPKTSVAEYWGGPIPWITSGTLTSALLDRSERTLTTVGAANGTKVVDRDSVIFVVRGMSLVREFRVGIADVSLAFGQDCKAIIAGEGVHPLYLGFNLIERAESIQGMVELAGHGTGKLSTDRLKALPLALPPAEVQEAFVERATPIRESLTALRLTTDQLCHLRDLLLPRLVTGQVDISHLDLDVLTEAATA